MQSFKWEAYQSIEKTVSELLDRSDPVILQFDVMPFDYKVKDVYTPKMFLTRTKLVLVIDDTIEVYNLGEIAVWIVGGKPNFDLIKIILEYRLDFSNSKTPLSKNIDIPEDFLRFAIMERNSLHKEFTLRKGNFPARSYQTWAFAQILRNLQKGVDDYRLGRMVEGSFSFFNGFFLTKIFLIFIIYALILIFFGSVLPNAISFILDFLFAMVCIGVLGWTFWTIFVNIKRYGKVYEGYRYRDSKMNPMT